LIKCTRSDVHQAVQENPYCLAFMAIISLSIDRRDSPGDPACNSSGWQ